MTATATNEVAIIEGTVLHRVQTASGRIYEIDLDGKRFRTEGEQEFAEAAYFGGYALADDPHHDWTVFAGLDVDTEGRLHIVEPSGYWRRSTRIVSGLADLVDALDGAK